MRSFLLTAIIFFIIPVILFSQDGAQDNHFGVNGKVTTDFEGYNDWARSIAIQSDGKIVVTGFASNASGYDVAVARYQTNGKLDSSFGVNGKIPVEFTGLNQGFALAIQTDKKIVVSGTTEFPGDILLLRYKENGELDSSFGTNGKITTDFNNGNDFGFNVGIQEDGKIIVAGYTQINLGQNSDFILARYKTNGTLDSTFGIYGKVITDFGFPSTEESMVISKEGKIILCGSVFPGDSKSDFAIARYQQDGNLDSSFGNNGKVITDFGAKEFGYGVSLQSNNKIIIGGTIFNNSVNNFIVARYKVNGELDSSFGTNGKQITNFIGNDVAFDAIVQPDDKIILCGGITFSDSNSDFALARYKPDGEPDSTFGIDGKQNTSFGGYAFSLSMALQKNGKIVLAGVKEPNGGSDNYDFALARYNNTEAILPVNFASFTAIKNYQSVLLNWNVCNEINNRTFCIQRSNTSNKWDDIGYIPSKGIDKSCNDYSFADTKPLTGNNYYRIKQIDNDGKFSYSKIVTVEFISSLSISPNPATNILTVKGLGNNNSVLHIVDANGKTVSSIQTTGDLLNWNIQNLVAGNYFLILSQNKKIITTVKFIKQ